MDFSSLVKAVQDFWGFIWPPVLCTLALVAIAAYVAPNWCSRKRAVLLAAKPSAQSQIAFVKISKRFGIDKLLPVLTAFTLLFLLSATRNVVMVVGSLIPVEVTYDPDLLLENHADSPRTAALWFAYGGDGSVSDFRQQIQRTVDEARQKNGNDSVVSGLQYWQKTAGEYVGMIDVCKFLVLYTLCMLLLELRQRRDSLRALGRCFLLLLVLSVASATYVALFLYATDQAEYSTLEVAAVYKAPQPHMCYYGTIIPADEEKCKLYADSMQPTFHPGRKRWWWIEFAFGSVFRWVFHGLTGQRPTS